MLRYVASTNLEFNLSASYSKEDDDSAPEVLIDAHPSTTDHFASAYNDMIFAAYGIRYDNRFLPPPGRPYSNYSAYTSPFRNHTYPNKNAQHSGDVSGSVDWDVADNVHAKAIVAHSEYGGSYTEDAAEDPFDISMAYGTFRVKQTTGELRFTGNLLDSKLEWAAGAFALDAHEHLGGDIDYVTLSWAVDDTVKSRNESGFLHAIYHLTNRLSLTAGGRYTAVHKSYDFQHPGLLVIPTPSIVSEHHADWLANLSYQITDDLMVYAQASTGFRPGGIFARPVTVYQLLPFSGEELTAYEVGLKSQWFDNRLRANIAGFYSDYNKHLTTRSEYQCLGETPPPTPKESPSLCPPGGFVTWGVSITTPATIKGIELELEYEPIDKLLIGLSGGYHQYRSGVHTPGDPGYVYPGNIGQPEYNANGSVQYTMKVTGGSLTPRLDWFYISHQTNGPRASSAPPDPLYIIPARSTFNARLTYQFDNSNWSVAVSCTNLTDKYYYNTLFSGSGLALSGNVAPPREWAFTVRRNF
jgi:iron complex outermembrane receptor protein